MANERGFTRIKKRAGDETRTRDIFLGKEVLYQLSYTRGAAIIGERLAGNLKTPSDSSTKVDLPGRSDKSFSPKRGRLAGPRI